MMQFGPTKTCTGDHGTSCGSLYPKDAVPEEKFAKDKSAKDQTPFKTCEDCRILDRSRRVIIRKGHKDKSVTAQKKIQEGASEYGYCVCPRHGGANPSQHDRDKIPIDSLRKVKGNKNSDLFLMCEDCRTSENTIAQIRVETIKAEAAQNGIELCGTCKGVFNDDRTKATNLDGSTSCICESCKLAQYKASDLLAQKFARVKTRTMLKNQCSCFKCKRIILRALPGMSGPLRLDTYEIDGIRYFDYDSKRCPVSFIIEKYPHLLELRVLDFDHLTEKEQRERGLLKPEDKFVAKVRTVCRMRSESKMTLEALKCQLLCVECHIIETIGREMGYAESELSRLTRQKMQYVNNLKAKGCSCCGYFNENMPRFFDMDRIDPSSKIDDVSEMVRNGRYTLNDVINECLKCRVLCKFCHRIHTSNQVDERLKIRNEKVVILQNNLASVTTPDANKS